MKKILITLMTVLALTAFAACESKPEEVVAEETTTASVAEVTTEKTEQTTEETETEAVPEETTVETEAETVAETESETTTESETKESSSDLFKGTGYTLSINSEKWVDFSEYISLVAQWAENTDAAQNLELTAEDIQNVGDAMYYHLGNGSNFNVTVAEIGNIGTLTDEMLKQLAVLMEQQYSTMTGYIYEGYEIVKINGYDAIRFDMSTDAAVFGTELKMNAYLFYYGTKQFAITYTADKSKYSESLSDFEEVLNSVSFE